MRARAVVVAVAVIAGGGHAAADDRKLAEGHARRGVALYNLGKYEAAITEFEAAYTLYQSDALLFDLGQAHRQLDHCEPALRYYRRFLAGRPAPEIAEDVQLLVPKLEAACAAKRERPDGADPDAADAADAAASNAAVPAPPPIVALIEPPAAPVDADTVDDRSDDDPPVSGPPPRAALGIVAAATGGAMIGERAAPAVGVLAAIAIPRRWRGADVTIGVSLDLRIVAWSDGVAAGASPAISVAIGLARRFAGVARGAFDLEVGGAVGGLVLTGLDQRRHPLATSGARDVQVLPGGRFELAVARPLRGRIELWTSARIGLWPAIGGVSGAAVIELDCVAGIRVRR